MTGDALKNVQEYACIRKPGQARVSQVVSPQVLEPELRDDLVPMCRVTQNGRADTSPARSCEQAAIW
jgi:hypothetical protein